MKRLDETLPHIFPLFLPILDRCWKNLGPKSNNSGKTGQDNVHRLYRLFTVHVEREMEDNIYRVNMVCPVHCALCAGVCGGGWVWVWCCVWPVVKDVGSKREIEREREGESWEKLERQILGQCNQCFQCYPRFKLSNAGCISKNLTLYINACQTKQTIGKWSSLLILQQQLSHDILKSIINEF